MAIDVTLPQMGESILEGTVTKWLKKVGDRVNRDESLFEVSTDKVDSEIPSPTDGILTEILVPEGQTVKVGTVVAVVMERARDAVEPGHPVESAGQPVPEEAAEPSPVGSVTAQPTEGTPAGEKARPEAEGLPESMPGGEAAPVVAAAEPPARTPESAPSPEREAEPKATQSTTAPQPFVHTSPLVRRIARDHGVDLSEIEGTGLSGRITREDVLTYLERTGRIECRSAPVPRTTIEGTERPCATAPAAPEAPRAAETVPAPRAQQAPPAQQTVAEIPPIEAPRFYGDTETVTMTPMRKAISEHMVLSKRTSAHVQTVFEVDMTSVVQLREKHKDEFEAREGLKLTYTPFFVKALVDTVYDFPILNCSVSGDKIIFKKAINVGIAVALETGLIVPVVKDAQLKSFTGLALAIRDVAERARTKRLKPEEVQHGTITVTNPGTYGSLFGTPIINQPQVAILGVGSLQKRPVIINDAIAIRTMVYLVLSFDHRIIDGAVADQAMAALKARLQSWSQWTE